MNHIKADTHPPYAIPHSLTWSTHTVMSAQFVSVGCGSVGEGVTEQGVVGFSGQGSLHSS